MCKVDNKLLSDVSELLMNNRVSLENDPVYYSVLIRLAGVANSRYIDNKVDTTYDVDSITSEVVNG